MDITKIKISPEVLKKDISQITYSGNTFGYYSGLTEYLSQKIIKRPSYRRTSAIFPGGFFLFLDGSANELKFVLSRFTNSFQDESSFFISLKLNQKIILSKQDGSEYEYYLREFVTFDSSNNTLEVKVKSPNGQLVPSFVANEIINFNITLENVSTFKDMSIPVFLKQTHEDIGYYSPFDGNILQLDSKVNFIFTADTLSPDIICISNTSDTSLTYLDETIYSVNWGDGLPSENVSVFFPESLCHLYEYDGSVKTYTISFTGSNKIGLFVVSKQITIPYTIDAYDNPYGTINFVSNNGSWFDSPSSQKYIFPYDADNTVLGQVSSNFVSVPFVVSGYTLSRLNDLKGFGINPFVVGKEVKLDDGETGQVTFISPSYTAYTINNLQYLDFPNNTSVFLVSSSGITDQMISQSAITKFEYLMNVIEEPIIQTNVFIERGKNSGLESFRRIGEVSNVVSLENYGYGFFGLRNYNDI